MKRAQECSSYKQNNTLWPPFSTLLTAWARAKTTGEFSLEHVTKQEEHPRRTINIITTGTVRLLR